MRIRRSPRETKSDAVRDGVRLHSDGTRTKAMQRDGRGAPGLEEDTATTHDPGAAQGSNRATADAVPDDAVAGHAPGDVAERAREIVRRSKGVQPSPSLLRVEERLRAGDASARQLAQLIEGSPALAARVLRLANSAFYAPLEPVVSLGRAVALLGDVVLRRLILTSLVVLLGAERRSSRQALASARLMGDSVRSAAVARNLAMLSGFEPIEDAFSAALLHDLGHIYLLDDVGDEYAGYLLSPDRDLGIEVELSGTTHIAIGGVFADDWGLPGPVAVVLREHHGPGEERLTRLIHAADLLVRELTDPSIFGDEEDGDEAPTERALVDLGIDPERWVAILPRVRAEFAELLGVFDLSASRS